MLTTKFSGVSYVLCATGIYKNLVIDRNKLFKHGWKSEQKIITRQHNFDKFDVQNNVQLYMNQQESTKI